MPMGKKENVTAWVFGGALLAGVIAVSATTFLPLLGQTPEPTKTSIISDQLEDSPTPTPSVTPTVEPTVEAPEPIVEAPPVVEEAPSEPDYGTPVPWIADPNNAEGGYWDTTACPSGAAYTAPDGNSYCG